MSTTAQQDITKLTLDLKNFRTTPQKSEPDAVKAMIAIKPDRFFAVMDSIVQDGYWATETIIVLKQGTKLVVKEGNRRIAILKLIHGKLKAKDFGIPDAIIKKIAALDVTWKKDNLKVPCTIFNSNEADKADRQVAITHGKGDKASRDQWTSVARARHNRDANKVAEPGLDLLEKYLISGNNLTGQQREKWSGDYPLTVLTEAITKIYNRFPVKNAGELAKKFETIKYRTELEHIIHDIGLENLETRPLRDTQIDFAAAYGIPPLPASTTTNTGGSNAAASKAGTNSGNTGTTGSGSGTSNNTTAAGTSATNAGPGKSKAFASNDPKQVMAVLKNFNPKGANRQKVVDLKLEMLKLKINETPIAFCFLLRSIFEISAKVYCSEKKISTNQPNGQEKKLASLLTEVTNLLTSNNTNQGMNKILHGAKTEITKPNGLLSITSMNQLVHNPQFSIIPKDICTLFGNIYPLLEAMN